MTHSYPIVQLHPHKENSWRFGHPWIYSRAISKCPSCLPGSLVSVVDHQGHFIGIGYFNSKQSIALRMLEKELIPIDASWFFQRFKQLQSYRKQFLTAATTAFRLCFGESDGIPGCVVDQYEQTAVVQVNTKGIEKLLPQILAALQELGLSCIVQAESISARKEGVDIAKTICQSEAKYIWAKENGLDVCVPLQKGQKTGWFCDQRDNRLLVKWLVAEQSLHSILNLFSYTGGFSLMALQGGAKRVVNVDQDAGALSYYQEMVQKNGLPLFSENRVENVWDYLAKERESFDLVITDPPAFVKEEKKKSSGIKGYKDLFNASIERVNRGGFLMLFSCSHFVEEDDLYWVLRQIFAESGRKFQTVQKLSQSFDHPVPAWFPEGNYLKGYLLKELI